MKLLGMAVQSGAIPKGSVHRWVDYKRRRDHREMIGLLARIMSCIKDSMLICEMQAKIDAEHDRLSKEMNDNMKTLNDYCRELCLGEKFLRQSLDINESVEPGTPITINSGAGHR